MKEFDSIVGTIAEYLSSRLNLTVCAYPISRMPAYDMPVTAVGIEEGTAGLTGFGEYLGLSVSAENGERELYGRRLDTTLVLYIYSPRNDEFGAGGCHKVFGDITAVMGETPFPLKVREISCGEIDFDGETEMFLCKCRVKCSCLLTGEMTDDGTITDFRLQGVMV